MKKPGLHLLATLFAVSAATSAFAGAGLAPESGLANETPAELKEVGVDDKRGNQVPLDARFTDEDGKSVALGDVLVKGKPTLLTLNYYECPMLCTLILNGVADGVRGLGFQPGHDFEIVTISINPHDTPALAHDKKANYLKSIEKPIDPKGWHFLVGDEANIKRVADAVGFRFAYDASAKQFSHGSAIFALTPAGIVSRNLYGIEFPPRDLRLALLEAGEGKLGTAMDKLVLYCFHYDPQGRKYSLYAMNVMRLAGGITVFAIVALVLMARRPSRKERLA